MAVLPRRGRRRRGRRRGSRRAGSPCTLRLLGQKLQLAAEAVALDDEALDRVARAAVAEAPDAPRDGAELVGRDEGRRAQGLTPGRAARYIGHRTCPCESPEAPGAWSASGVSRC